MSRFRETYDSLPDSEKDKVMGLLFDLLRRRGYGMMNEATCWRLASDIATVFSQNGHELEQFT